MEDGLSTASQDLHHSLEFEVIDLGILPGNDISGANALNDKGAAAGVSWQVLGHEHGTYWPHPSQLKQLPTLPGDLDSNALGLNNHGLVVGYSRGGGYEHPVWWWGGSAHWLPGLTSANSGRVWAVNDHNYAVGSTLAPTGYHAVRWHGSAVLDLGTLGGSWSTARGINECGTVVGTSALAGDAANHPFLWRHGHLDDLGTPAGNTRCRGNGLNDREVVVGSCDDNHHPFRWKHGQFTVLPWTTAPQILWSDAWRVNDKGFVVGTEFRESGLRAVLWAPDNEVHDLNDLIPAGAGWVLDEAFDINSRMEIVGSGIHLGHEHAYLLKPVHCH